MIKAMVVKEWQASVTMQSKSWVIIASYKVYERR